MNKIITSIIVITILIIRFWGLELMPPHLRNDEASLGYNAYSILKTARDEHGKLLPILFESFGDWKPGLYIYLTVPFISILGLNELAVRLPSAISGILGIYLLYLLVQNLFQSKKIALASAFSLAISPWHIAFSRGAWEAQVTVTLILAGLFFFTKAIKQNYKYLILATGFWGISLFMSHSAKPAIPLLLIAILFAFWKKIIKIPLKVILVSGLLFSILSLLIIFSFMNGKNTRVSSLLFTNKYPSANLYMITKDFLRNWGDHYYLPSLFLKGDGNPQHTASDFGAFLPLDIVFLLLGSITLARLNSIQKETKKFIILLLILMPLSSVLTSEGVNFVRYLMFLIPINILIGLGLSNFKKNSIWGTVLTLYIFSFLLFLDAYFVHTPAKNGAWQNGYKQIVNFISPIQNNYSKIYIPQGTDQPYIFFLVYQKYPPEKYQAMSSSVVISNGSEMGMNYVSRLDNIEFIDLRKLSPIDKPSIIILPIHNTYKFEGSQETIYEIQDPIGFPIYKIDRYIPRRQ